MDAPTLHIVHAGRGDAMYLEFETVQQGNLKKHLMAVDGGPRDSGNYHKGGDKSQRRQMNHAVHDKARFRQYYKFFASAGKMIYYDDMEMPAKQKFILSSMVCTHPHEDHVEGLLDMLQHAGRTVELDLGFILPAYLKNKNFEISTDPANPTKTHVDEVYRILVEASGKDWYPEKLNRDLFIGGDIVYPPPRNQNHPRRNDTDKSKDLILIRSRRPTDPNIDKTAFLGMFGRIADYVAVLNGNDTIEKRINMTSCNNLNLASILLQVPGGKWGDIFLTGDNNGNLIHHYITRGVDNSFTKGINNKHVQGPRRHYAIYKIAHHGSSEDSQINVGNWRIGQMDDTLKEFAVFGTLAIKLPELMAAEFQKAVKDLTNSHRTSLENLATLIWKQINLEDKHFKAYVELLEDRMKEFMASLRFKTPITGIGDKTPQKAWDTVLADLVADFDKNFLAGDFFEKQQVKSSKGSSEEIQILPKEWFRQWWRGWKSNHPNTGRKWETGTFDDVLRAVTRTRCSREFFRSFTADAYVVSSNGKQYPHPHAATLVGLAWALMDEERRATLYITDAWSFKLDYFESHAKICGQSPKNLSKYLSIRYPKDTVYFSLTAAPFEGKKDSAGRFIGTHLGRDEYGSLGWTTGDAQDPLRYDNEVHALEDATVRLKWGRQTEKVAKEIENRHELMEAHSKWQVIDRSMATIFRIAGADHPIYAIPDEKDGLTFVKKVDYRDKLLKLAVRIRSSWEEGSTASKTDRFFVSRKLGIGLYDDDYETHRRVITLHPARPNIPDDDTYHIKWRTESNIKKDKKELEQHMADGKPKATFKISMTSFTLISGKVGISEYKTGGQVPAFVAFRFSPIIGFRPTNLIVPIVPQLRMMRLDDARIGSGAARVAEMIPVDHTVRAESVGEARFEEDEERAGMTTTEETSFEEEEATTEMTPAEEGNTVEVAMADTAEDQLELTPGPPHDASSVGPGRDEDAKAIISFRATSEPATIIRKDSSLDNYLATLATESRSNPITVNTAMELLAVMLSKEDLAGLSLRPHEKALLSLPLDASSTIDFTTDALAVTVQGANLKTVVNKSTTTEIGGIKYPVVYAEAQFYCGIDENMDLFLYVSTAQSSGNGALDETNDLLIRKRLRRSAQETLLLKIITAITSPAGFTGADIAKFDVIDVLALVIESDKRAVNMFLDRMPYAMVALKGFLHAKPDWSLSTGQAVYNIFGNIDVRKASIIIDLASIIDAKRFQLGPLSVSLTSLRIDVLEARSPSQRVLLGAAASFVFDSSYKLDGPEDDDERPAAQDDGQTAVSETRSFIDAHLTVDLHSEYEIMLTFLLGKASSFSDVMVSLDHKSQAAELDSLEVPFTSVDGTSTDNNKTMDKLNLKPGTLGFKMRQPVSNPCPPTYIVDRIFASVDLADWKIWLPVKFPHVFKDGSVIVQVDVLSPLDAKRRRVRVDIDFVLQLDIGFETTKDVKASLVAIPLVAKGDYEFRIELSVPYTYEALSLLEFTTAVGLNDVVSNVTQDLPLIKNVLETVRVRTLSTGISPGENGWEFSDWSVAVELVDFDMIPGKVAIRDVAILLQKIGTNQGPNASLTGHIDLSIPTKAEDELELTALSPPTRMFLDFTLPTTSEGGDIWLSIPDGVSLQDMISLFGLDKFNDTPVVGQILDTQLRKMQLKTSSAGSPGGMAIQSFEIELHQEELKVGPLVFTHLEVSFEWISAAAQGGKSSITTYLSVFMLDQAVVGSLCYLNSPDQRRFGVSLAPSTSTSNSSIGRMLRACLPSNMRGLETLGSFLDHLMLQRAEIGFANLDTVSSDDQDKTLTLSYFEFHVLHTTPLQVQKVVLRELRVLYKNEEINFADHPEALPESETAVEKLKARQPNLAVLAVIEKENTNNTKVKARIEIWAITVGDSQIIAFSLLPTETDSLTVLGLLSMFDFSEDSLVFPHPEECPPVLSISLDGVAGELTNVEPEDETDTKEVPEAHETGTSNLPGNHPSESGDPVRTTKDPDEEVKGTPPKTLKLRRFGTVARINKDINVIKIQSKTIQIKDLVLHIVYDSAAVVKKPGSNLTGILKGKISIGQLVIEAAFGFDRSVGAWVFAASAPLKEILSLPKEPFPGNQPVGDPAAGMSLKDLASSTGMDADAVLDLKSTNVESTIKPNTLGTRIRLTAPRQIDIWALGDDVWTGKVCGVALNLEKIAVFFRYTEGPMSETSLTRKDPVVEAYVAGQLLFKGWTAEAAMSIGQQRNAILTARLRKQDSTATDLNLFSSTADDVASTGDLGSWSDLVPALETSSFKIAESHVFLFADLKEQKFVVSAAMESLGSALFLSKVVDEPENTKKPDDDQQPKEAKKTEANTNIGIEKKEGKKKRRYIFMLEAQRLNQLWSDTDSEIDAQFDIRTVSVQIFGYKTSVAELRKELEVLSNSLPDFALLNTPPTKAELDTDMVSATKKAEEARKRKVAEEVTEPQVDTTSAQSALERLRGLPERNLEPGAWFFAEIGLGGQQRNMTDVILLDGKANQSVRVRLYALIPKTSTDTPTAGAPRIEYGIDIRNLQFFDGAMTINGNGKYLPSTKALSLSATIQLKLDASDTQALNFGVNLNMDKRSSAFAANIDFKYDQVVENPFGGAMFNVKLSSLSISGSSTKKESRTGVVRQCTIRGKATLGTKADKQFLGIIHFQDSKAALIVVEYGKEVEDATPKRMEGSQDQKLTTKPVEATVPMSDVYQQVLRPSSGSWPSDTVDDFVLKEAYLSYNNTKWPITIGERTYAPDFFLYGSFELFEMPISVSMLIDKSRKGVFVTGNYTEVIDLGLVKLTSFHSKDGQTNVDGLSLSLDTRNGIQFGVASGLTLFDKPGFYLTVDYKPNGDANQREFSGKAMYNDELLDGILQDPSIEFAYKRGRWSLKNLQLRRDASWNSDGGLPFDLNKAIEWGSKLDGDCGKLIGFVIDQVLDMKFTFSLSLPNMKQSDMKAVKSNEGSAEANAKANQNPDTSRNENKDGFKFIVSWWIDITIAGFHVGKVKVTEFPLTVSFKGFSASFSGFMKLLWEQVLSEKNMAEVGKAVLSDPEVLGKLLVEVTVKKLAQEIFEKLLCRKPKQPKGYENMKERSKEIQAEKKKEQDKKLDDTSKDLDKVKDGSKPGGGTGGGPPPLPPPPPPPLPPLPPLVPIPLPIPMPLPVPTIPSIPPGDEKPIPETDLSLVDCIRLYLMAVGKLKGITPDELLKGIGQKMLNHPDKEYGNYVDGLYKALKQDLEKVQKSREEARSDIEKRMTLYAQNLIAGYYSNEADSTIGVPLTQVLPWSKAVFEDDYNYVKWQIFASTEDKGPSRNETLGVLTYDGKQRIIVAQSDEFRYQKNTYLWVRMWVSMGDEEFASPQWYRVVAKNPFPYLRSPRGVQIRQDDRANGVVVTLPSSDIAPGDWSVALVDDSVTDPNASTTPLISSPFASPSCGPSEFFIPVARLPFNIQPSYKTIRAQVIQKALDPKAKHDSLPVFSYQSLGVISAPMGLEARFTSPAKVGVKWLRSEGLDVTAYVVTVVRTETQKEVRTEQTVAAFDEGFVTTEVTLPEATATAEGEMLSIRVAAKRAGLVNLIAEYALRVTIPTVINIEPESNLHLESGILTLIVSSNTPFPADPEFKVWRKPSSGSGEQEQAIFSTYIETRRAVLRLQPSPVDGSYVVRTGSATTSAWILKPWDGTAQPLLEGLKATADTGKTVRVSWMNGKPGVQVRLAVYGETVLHSAAGEDAAAGILIDTTVPAEQNSVVLGGGGRRELAKLANGTTVVVNALVWALDKTVVIQTVKMEVVLVV